MSIPLALLALGCAEPARIDLTVIPSEEVGTVAIARWTTPEPTVGELWWGEEGPWERRIVMGGPARTEHQLWIPGLYPDTEYHFRVQAEGSEQTWESGEVAMQTSALPAALVDFQVKGDPAAFEGLLPLVVDGADPKVVVIDATGQVVWYHRFEDSQVSPRRAWYIPERRSFLVLSHDDEGEGELTWLSLVGVVQRRVPLLGAHHDFTVLPDGAVLVISEDPRIKGGIVTVGDAIDHIDIDGVRTRVWSIWDQFDFDDEPPIPGGDWTHANAIDHVPDAGLVLLGLRHFDSILALDDQSFALRWAIGGDVGSVQVDEGSRFMRQHQFHLVDDRLLVFDNHAGAEVPEESRVVEFELDLDGRTATEVWRYTHDPPTSTDVLGSVELLASGSRLVNWGILGQLQVVSEDKQVEWQLDMLLGSVPSYADRFGAF